MYSKEKICNRALRMLKAPLLSSLEDSTKEAEHCTFLYPIVKAEILSMYSWKKALREVNLNCIDDNYNRGNYKYKYLLPKDVLTIINVNNIKDFLCDNKYLFTNSKEAKIQYMANLDESELDATLAKLISYKMALELSYSYDVSINIINLLQNSFDQEYLKMSNIDSKIGDNLFAMEEDSSWIMSRY